MSIIAELTIPAEKFALRETLEQHPDITLEIERVVAHDTLHVTPFIWASGREHSELLSTFEADSSIEESELVGEYETECLYRMKWTNQTEIIDYMIFDENATVQQAIASNRQWRLRVLFPERSGLSRAFNYAKEHESRLDINQIYDTDTIRRVRFNLTEEQHEALTEAAEHGYYTIPRKITQTELADVLGISTQATSERIRRATLSIIENALLVEEDEESNNHPLN